MPRVDPFGPGRVRLPLLPDGVPPVGRTPRPSRQVLEEFGLSINAAQGVPDEAAREAGYQTWVDAVRDQGGAGDQFWLLTSRVDDGTSCVSRSEGNGRRR